MPEKLSFTFHQCCVSCVDGGLIGCNCVVCTVTTLKSLNIFFYYSLSQQQELVSLYKSMKLWKRLWQEISILRGISSRVLKQRV